MYSLQRGADIKRRDERTGNTVLHVVAESGHFETARYLVGFCPNKSNVTRKVKSKPSIDINAVNNDKKTALQVAAEKGNCREIVCVHQFINDNKNRSKI